MSLSVSIIVCSFNGAQYIEGCIESLLQQTYKDIEIIFVNDGSTDDILEKVKKYPIKVITNQANIGLGASRNVGISNARSEIIAFTDDDCIAEKTWIEQLITIYLNNQKAIGVGGKVVPHQTSTLLLKYIQANNPLAPLAKNLAYSSNIAYKFILYLKRSYIPIDYLTHQTAVYSLVGASMSFRKKFLQDVGMFNPAFRFGGEEEDLCKRLGKAYPEMQLVYNPNAITYHKYDTRWNKSIKRNHSYGSGNARMYCKDKDQNPIIYPFPYIIIFGLLSIGFINISAGIFSALFLTYTLYGHWIFRIFIDKKITYVVFPFIQILFEMATNIGFINGYIKYKNKI